MERGEEKSLSGMGYVKHSISCWNEKKHQVVRRSVGPPSIEESRGGWL